MPSFRPTFSVVAAAFTLNACASASEPQRAASPVQEVPTKAATMTEERAAAERAESHFQAGRFDEAIPLFRHAIELRPDSSRLYNRVAESYVALGLFDKAELWTRRARANTPEAPWPGFWHCIFGWLAALEGERAALALHTDSLLMAASPEAPLAWSCAASNEIYLGEYADARTHIERFRTEAPDRHAPLAHYGFALLQTEEERPAELLRDYEARRRAEIAEDPGKWDAHYTLAEIEAIRGNKDAAVGHLSEAVRQGAGDQFWFYYTVSDDTWGDPIWESVRGHPGFERLMAELKADVERMRERLLREEGSDRKELVERLDSLANAALAERGVAGFSVAVLRGSDTLLLKGYGQADVGLDVPATAKTKYRLVGPGATMQAALLMRQVEQERISLDEDVTPRLPDFPWQGRSVTLRQLMDATSGLPDYHYLGDPYLSEIAVPKSQDEVTALFAGRPFTHEPGERFQWTISGFHLAGVLLERVSGRSFGELIEEEIARPVDLEHTVPCGGREIVSDLATGYKSAGDSLLLARPESPSMYPFTVTVCASAGDVATFYQSLREGRLIKPESYEQMTTLSAAAREEFERSGSGLAAGLDISHLEGHSMAFMFGGLLIGYGSAAIDFPEDDLTVVVLTNTYWSPNPSLALNIARAALGLPLSEAGPNEAVPSLRDLPVPQDELERYAGAYRTRAVDPRPPYRQYERTYRVYNESGRLMIQPVGEPPERLLRQGEHTFARASDPEARLVFTVEDGRASGFEIREEDSVEERGSRLEEVERTSAG